MSHALFDGQWRACFAEAKELLRAEEAGEGASEEAGASLLLRYTALLSSLNDSHEELSQPQKRELARLAASAVCARLLELRRWLRAAGGASPEAHASALAALRLTAHPPLLTPPRFVLARRQRALAEVQARLGAPVASSESRAQRLEAELAHDVALAQDALESEKETLKAELVAAFGASLAAPPPAPAPPKKAAAAKPAPKARAAKGAPAGAPPLPPLPPAGGASLPALRTLLSHFTEVWEARLPEPGCGEEADAGVLSAALRAQVKRKLSAEAEAEARAALQSAQGAKGAAKKKPATPQTPPQPPAASPHVLGVGGDSVLPITLPAELEALAADLYRAGILSFPPGDDDGWLGSLCAPAPLITARLPPDDASGAWAASAPAASKGGAPSKPPARPALSDVAQALAERLVLPLAVDAAAPACVPPVLLCGAPGSGKGSLARCAARAAGAVLLDLSPRTWASSEEWAGKEGAQRLCRSVFSVAAALAPSFVLVEEAHLLLSGDGDGDSPSRMRPFLMKEAERASRSRVALLCCTSEPAALLPQRREVAQLFGGGVLCIPSPDHRSRVALWRRGGAGQFELCQELADASAGRSAGQLVGCAREASAAASFREAALAALAALGAAEPEATMEGCVAQLCAEVRPPR